MKVGKRPIHWTELAVFAGVLLIAALLQCYVTAKAEWVRVDKFSGISTSYSAAKLAPEKARLSVGFSYWSDQAAYGAERSKTNTIPQAGNATWLLSGYDNQDQVIFFDGQLRSYNIGANATTTIQDTATTAADTAHTVGTDSTIVVGEGLNDTVLFRYVLSDASSIVYNDSTFPLSHVYSGKYVRLTRGTPMAAGNKKYQMRKPVSVSGQYAAVEWNDTTLIVDGVNMTTYTGGKMAVPTPPNYTKLKTADSLVSYGSNLYVVGPAASFSRSDINKYLLPNDTSIVSRARIARIIDFDTVNAAKVRLKLAADSSVVNRCATVYASTGLRVAIFTHSRATNYYGIITRDSLLSASKIGSTYQTTIIGHISTGVSVSNSRAFDGMMFDSRSNNTVSINSHRYQTYIVRPSPLAGAYEFLFQTDSLESGGYSDAEQLNPRFWILWSKPNFAVVSSGTVASKYRIAELHRRKCFYAGNDDSTNWYYYTGVNNYDSIAGGEDMEGQDPVTALSSLGGNLELYRRRSISELSGFSTTDFYLVPAPAGVGAVSDASVARDPLQNRDIFLNDLGLWSNAGGGVQQIPTDCAEIFQDSINWAYEKNIVAAVFDYKYWFSAPFGTATSNNRLITVDLTNGAVGFVGGPRVSSFRVRREPGGKERLFAGDLDSGVVWELGAGSAVGTADRRSGWYDGGDRALHKKVNNYSIGYESASAESLMVQFYIDGSETTVWADTIVAAAAGYKKFFAAVPGKVQGSTLAYGFITSSKGVRVLDFAWDIVTMGQERRQ